MLANGNVPISYSMLSGGFAGTYQTVAEMTKLTTGQWGSRSPKIRALAINILRQAGIPGKDYVGEMVAIHNWVRDNVRYTRDVAGQETLCPPEEIAFNSRAGDCDDMAMLDAALLGAIGIPSRFVTIGVTPDSFSHVYLQAKPKGTWIPLDPIMKDKPAGWEAPKTTAVIKKVYPDNIPEDAIMNSTSGLGYIGDPRVFSHLDEEPPPAPAAAPYVQMDSMLDSDQPTASICAQRPAFPQQTYDAMYPGQLRQAGATIIDTRMTPQQVADQVRADNANLQDREEAGMNQGNWFDSQNGLMDPGMLGAMAFNPDVQGNGKRMQRPGIAAAPEGVDNRFTRQHMVFRPERGDQVVYRGLYALSERPPIRPVTGVQGLGADTAAPAAPVVVAPAPSKAPTLVGVALLGLGLYLYLNRKK